MSLFKKPMLFSLLLLTQTPIQSSSLFKNRKGEARITNNYEQSEFADADYSDIPEEELFVIMDPSCDCAKLASFEQTPSGRYKVSFFTVKNPNISAEFANKEEAQGFLYDFMMQQEAAIQKPLYFPLPPRGSGQDWRRVPSRHGRR